MSTVSLKIKRIDKNLPLPAYQTAGAVGFDLYARVETTVEPGQIALIPSNVIARVPQGYALIIASRSSTPRKLGLSVPHGIGVIDQDYCGTDDEIQIQVYNFTAQSFMIEKGTRIAQALLVRVDQAELAEVEEAGTASRGGFGSTGAS